ncbi:MAG: hypothetical protein RI575_18915 [Balneolaceae bacterium]|nr:hypothetical protein [Balneolaceae bacterium]
MICSLLTASIIGCQKSGSTPDYPAVDDPAPPRHSLHIEGEIEFNAEVSWVNSTHELQTKIWAVNSGSDTAIIETGVCAFNVLAYTPSEEGQKLVWYNKMPENYICMDEMLVYTIPPNDTIQVEGQVYISGNHWQWSIPQGKWKFVLEAYTEEGQSIKVNANTLTIN